MNIVKSMTVAMVLFIKISVVAAIEGVVTTAIPEWNNARVFIQCSSNNTLTTFCNKLYHLNIYNYVLRRCLGPIVIRTAFTIYP